MQVWISSRTPGSGWGVLGFESGSYQRLTAPLPVLVIMTLSKGNALAINAQLIPYTMDLQTKVIYFKELVV